MWLVVVKRDFYPEVLEFETEAAAREHYPKAIDDAKDDESGPKTAKVYLVEVKAQTAVPSHR